MFELYNLWNICFIGQGSDQTIIDLNERFGGIYKDDVPSHSYYLELRTSSFLHYDFCWNRHLTTIQINIVYLSFACFFLKDGIVCV